MSLHEITFDSTAHRRLIVTHSGWVHAQDGFEEDLGRVRGFSFDVMADLPDVSIGYAVTRNADVTGMFALLTSDSRGDEHRRLNLEPVTGFYQVSDYEYQGDVAYIRDEQVVALLTDPDFHKDGAVYADIAAKHGLTEDDWTKLTLGSRQAIVWKETLGFTASAYGEELIAASTTA